MATAIAHDQEYVPVITGGLQGTYTLAREFHAYAGVRSAFIPSVLNRHLKGTRLGQAYPTRNIADPEVLLGALERVSRELGGGSRPLLFLPAVDHHVEAGVSFRKELLDLGYVMPDLDTSRLEEAALKENFYRACRTLDIPYPKSLIFDCMAASGSEASDGFIAAFLDRVEALDDFAFPLIVKGSDGSTWANLSFPGKRKVYVVHSRTELGRILSSSVGAGYTDKIVVQRFIAGPDNQLRILTQYRNHAGALALSGYGEVLLEDHRAGLEGNARAVLSSRDDEVARQGAALLEHFNWSGFAMFDLKVDPNTGRSYFLEMNPRLGQHHFYLTLAGHNPAETLVNDLITKANSEQSNIVDAPALSLTLPLRAALTHATTTQASRIREARSQGRVGNPWKYSGDFRLQHRLYLRYRSLRER